MQAVSKARDAVQQLQQLLVEYGEQPIMGSLQPPGAGGAALHASLQAIGMPTNPAQPPATAAMLRSSKQPVTPLMVLLMHRYQQAVHEQCRRHAWEQHVLGDGCWGWEAAAQACAEQQVQWFIHSQYSCLVELLLLVMATAPADR